MGQMREENSIIKKEFDFSGGEENGGIPTIKKYLST